MEKNINKSVWSNEVTIERRENLQNNIECEVLIIGAGMAGILIGHKLKEKGINPIIIEANIIGGGITANTTAKISLHHNLIYDKLIKNFGEEKAKLYLDANNEALKEYENLCKNIECNFEKKDSYIYTLQDREKILREVNAINNLGINAQFVEDIDLPFSIKGAVKVSDQAQFNPLSFLKHISKDLRIFEHTMAKSINNMIVQTNNGKIKAHNIVIATHYPFINTPGYYFLRMYQERSYVIAVENGPNINGIYIDEAQDGYSFRNYNNLLFIGGSNHRTGKKTQYNDYGILRNCKDRYFPETTEKYHWATQDCMSLDNIPYIGRFSTKLPNIYVATGFNKWGMTSSMVSAMIISDLITGKNSKYLKVFTPDRFNLKASTVKLATNTFSTVSNFIRPTTKRCPHLGCALNWNATEQTWDCPCHGSRFTHDGDLINNPAKKGLNDDE